MAVCLDLQKEHIRIVVWKLEETYDELLALLPKGNNYTEEANLQFKSQLRKAEWIAVRVLFHWLLGSKDRIVYDEKRKPYLLSGNGHISISHTKGHVAIAYCSSFCIGIDIEKIGSKALSVKNAFIHPKEDIKFENEKDTVHFYTLLWSAKESVYKLYNVDGLSFKCMQAEIVYPNTTDAWYMHVLNQEERKVINLSHTFQTDYVLTWAHL